MPERCKTYQRRKGEEDAWRGFSENICSDEVCFMKHCCILNIDTGGYKTKRRRVEPHPYGNAVFMAIRGV